MDKGINEISESSEEELIDVPDVLIVHGSGLSSNKAGRKDWLKSTPEKRLPKSSWDARMRLTAVGELWQQYKAQGREVPIIVSGGNVFPELAPSLAITMKEDLMRRFGIPEEKIIEGKGENTVSGMDEAEKIMKENGLSTGINISSGHHLVAVKLAKERGMEFIPAETILENRDPRYKRIIQELEQSPTMKSLVSSQEKGVSLIKIPLIGKKLYKLIANRTLAQRAEVKDFDPCELKKITGK